MSREGSGGLHKNGSFWGGGGGEVVCTGTHGQVQEKLWGKVAKLNVGERELI